MQRRQTKLDLLPLQSLNLGGHGRILRVGDADLLAQLREAVRFERLHAALGGCEGGMGGTCLTEFGFVVAGTGWRRLGPRRRARGRRGVWRRLRSALGRVITVDILVVVGDGRIIMESIVGGTITTTGRFLGGVGTGRCLGLGCAHLLLWLPLVMLIFRRRSCSRWRPGGGSCGWCCSVRSRR
jgi:hypothetical protein